MQRFRGSEAAEIVEVRGFEPRASSVREKKRLLRYLRISEESLVVYGFAPSSVLFGFRRFQSSHGQLTDITGEGRAANSHGTGLPLADVSRHFRRLG
jgi:hypothetical protein